ncbi:hypothetical protein RISK_005587 [Rhodopirellula islandica]|uniref:Uncharacterized protein n=1 Tax=Rhodopirellula islandica TaxID=595434 RepID=A0A0J1B7U6_RHOIS|nr:hypothetical protein RISK_005587 [Rhodopirellula islandica]
MSRYQTAPIQTDSVLAMKLTWLFPQDHSRWLHPGLGSAKSGPKNQCGLSKTYVERD